VGKYYQYANRLAHLYFLREINGLDARLIFLYFLSDPDTRGPRSRAEWKPAIAEAHLALGLSDRLPSCVNELFIDVRQLQDT
jgi:hypothetical protein